MAKTNSAHLSKDEIEEELLNNELMNSGGIENEVHLQKMNYNEKKNLLRSLQQSKEEFPSESSSQTPPLLDSTSNFPSLPVTGKSNSKNKLKLPRKTTTSAYATDSDDNSDKCITLLDDEDDVIPLLFSLPHCRDDGASPLVLVDRPQKHNKNVYYVMDGENPSVALKRMLIQHNRWKEAYKEEKSRIESHTLGEDIEYSDSAKQRDSPKNDDIEEKENDPYNFVSNSPVNPKGYSGPRKRETNMSVDNSPPFNNRQLQRKTSRDSDCEEVEPILKTEEPKVSEWRTANRSRSKRNRKQQPNQAKGQVFEESHEVEFDFEKKWDPQSSNWRSSPSPSSSSLNNQVPIRKNTPNSPVVEEKKVQCPICQRNFAISKVENHAATCEGFSSSPMDIEEET